MERTEFEAAVSAALDSLPDPLAALVDNVVVLVEEEPEAGEGDLLGLYVGTPLTERDTNYSFVPPDQIFIYRGPHLRLFEAAELARQIEITVVHELAHHFGIEDDQLAAWGYG